MTEHASPEDRQPWHWTPGLDNPEHWAAFNYYLRLPPPRSLQVVAGAYAVTYGQISGWARAEDWKNRALAYDQAIQKELQEHHESAIKEDATKLALAHKHLLRLQRSTLEREALKLHKQVHDTPHVPVLRPQDLTKGLAELIKAERLVQGQATEIAGQDVDLSKLTQEELDQYEALQRKARGG